MFLAVLVMILLFVWFGMRKQKKPVTFDDLKAIVHKYSGLDPESYTMFDENMTMFESTKHSGYMYTAIEYARRIGLSIINSDDGHITSELNKVADEIGYRGELLINNPRKYLNNKIDYSVEDVDIYDPFWARREAAGEIRTNRRG